MHSSQHVGVMLLQVVFRRRRIAGGASPLWEVQAQVGRMQQSEGHFLGVEIFWSGANAFLFLYSAVDMSRNILILEFP